MNKKLALQKLAQLRDYEKEDNRRRFITSVYNDLKMDCEDSLSMAISIIKEYKGKI